MKTLFAKIFCFSVLLVLSSCSSLLDVDNPSQITGEGYWKDKGEVDSYLTGVYTLLRGTINTLEYFETRSEYFAGGLEGSGSNQWAQNLTSQNGIGWGNFYEVIQHCNMILKHIPDINYTNPDDKNTTLAQVYTIRAYMYFCLVRLWGDAPLELTATESSNKPKPSRSPKVEVVDQIISDLDEAISLFPSGVSLNKSYANLKSAYALKADVLLWKAKVLNGSQQDLEDVIKYADMASEGLSLEEDFANIYNSKNGNEVIWSVHFGYPEYSGHYSSRMTLRDVFVKTAVNMEEVPYAISGARSSYQPSDEARAMFNKYPGDLRKNNSYIDAIDKNGNILGTSENKMVGTKTETNRIFDNDIIIYRLAEMILFKAEAHAALNQIGEAVSELNIIRRRAGIGDYSGAVDKQSVELEILDERGREFWLENKRWPDLIRFHNEGVIDIYDFVPNLKSRKEAGIIVPLYYAIPLSEMDLNENLKQTEGYE